MIGGALEFAYARGQVILIIKVGSAALFLRKGTHR